MNSIDKRGYASMTPLRAQGVVTVSCPSMTFTRVLECRLGRDAGSTALSPSR